MHRIVTTLSVCALLVGVSHNAAAQTTGWQDRAYINVGFGVESGTSELNDAKTFTIYEETGTVVSTSSWTSGSLFDVGVGLRVWKNLSVGAAYHQEMNTSSAKLTGTVPHPIFFNQPRTYSNTAEGLERRENAEHLIIGWTIPYNDKMDLMVYGGPSWFRLQQDVVADVKFGESGAPFTTVVVQPSIVTHKQSVVGYNVGTDFSYLMWQNDSVRIGAGLFMRYTTATANVMLLQTEQPTKVGGIQFGFGGRVRF